MQGSNLIRVLRLATFVCVIISVTGCFLFADDDEFLALDDEGSRRVELHGKWRLSNFSYFQKNPNSEERNLIDNRLRINARFPIASHAAVASVEGLVRTWEPETKKNLDIRELYFDFRPDPQEYRVPYVSSLSLRAGYQIFSWGSGVLFNPTDNLSPQYSIDPFDTKKKGIPAAKLTLGFGLQSFECILIPTFFPTDLPYLNERFFIHRPKTVANTFLPALPVDTWTVRYKDIDSSQIPDHEIEESQFAFRYSAVLRGWDVALSYFNGRENIAVSALVPVTPYPATKDLDARVQYVHPRQQVYGLDILGYYKLLGIRFEGAFFDMEKVDQQVGNGDKDYVSCLWGIDYPFNDFYGTQDAQIFLEYVREFQRKSDNTILINRPYQNSLLVRLTHTYDYRLSGEFRYVYNFDTHGSHIHGEYGYQYTDYTRIEVGIDFFNGHRDTFFGAYDTNDRVYFMHTLQF